MFSDRVVILEPRLKIEYLSTDELVPYAHNAKEHPDWQVGQIAASIEQFGFSDPVGVWTDGTGALQIVEGHGRVLAARELGMDCVPCVRLDHLDDEGRRAYTHIHNKLTENTGSDWAVLADEMAAMPAFQWTEYGFEQYSPDDFGIDFDLRDNDAPLYRHIALEVSQEQFDILTEALEMLDRCQCEVGGGNEMGDKVTEVCRQWAELKICSCG